MEFELFESLRIRRAIGRARGAATTEKLVVVVMAVLILVPMFSIFAPLLAAKFEALNVALGGTPTRTTLADNATVHQSDGTWVYLAVLFVFGSAFFVVFVSPLLFPRARGKRQEFINSLAAKLPFLEPLADWHSDGMDELHAMNQDLKKRPNTALEIAAVDLGSTSNPNEQTVTRGALDLPDMRIALTDDLAPLDDLNAPLDELSEALNAPLDELNAPLDELSEALGQIEASVQLSGPHSTFKPILIGSADDSATIDVRRVPNHPPRIARRYDPFEDDDPSLLTSVPIEEIDPSRVRSRARLNELPNDPDATIDAEMLRGTLPTGVRPADDPDASTQQNLHSYPPKKKE